VAAATCPVLICGSIRSTHGVIPDSLVTLTENLSFQTLVKQEKRKEIEKPM